jgi:hypothetical protein
MLMISVGLHNTSNFGIWFDLRLPDYPDPKQNCLDIVRRSPLCESQSADSTLLDHAPNLAFVHSG